ncbi:MAG TPA: hypothetical protein VMW30_04710 [Candidatus Paceibacterota bacterium]|nr:hypothetical protein [Candidatus Paceibacterota bacterium]
MNIALVIIAILTVLTLGRVVFLDAEIRTLDSAGLRFGRLVKGWQAGHIADTPPPPNIVEAEIEYDWLVNARDSKKESRTIWLGTSALLVVLLVSAIIQIARN